MFSKYIHKRIRIVLIIIIICFILIIGKVFYIQVIDYKKLNKYANSLWSRNLPIEADRGRITTSDGTVIADNLTTVSLIFIPNQIDKDKKEEIATNIASILKCNVNAIKEHIYKSSSIERVHPEGRRLDYEEVDAIDKLNYEGVYLVKESKRIYPHDLLLCHTLGYVGIDNQGLSGLELQYDDYLTGAAGSIQYYSDAKGQKLKRAENYVEPTNGIDIELTINYDIQNAIERELDNAMKKYQADGAWSLAMDPNTGEILGIASRPGFDPNNYQDYSTEEINRNLAIWSTYEPGSTFKIVTLATALEEGVVDLDKDGFFDGGSVNVDGARIKCWKHGGHGQQTFLEVVQNSCNPGFVELGRRLGKETLFKYIDNFGFGEKTGIDLNGEGKGILFNLDRVGPVELATTAFGQGVSVTAIQQVAAVSAAVNGGTLYQPYVVKRLIEPETKEIIQENKPKKVRTVISEDTSSKVRYALEHVVALGSGRNAYIENYRIGGKTGTAQKVNNGVYMVGNYITSFICFLPADNPRVVLYVAIDYPKGITAYGGTVVALTCCNKKYIIKPLLHIALYRFISKFTQFIERRTMDKFNIRRLEGYTIMSNHHLRDQKISHSARGLLSFMLSLPDNWDYSFNGLVAISKEGKSAIRSMINELKEAQYIKINRSRNEKGYFQYNYDVYEFPCDMPAKMVNYPTPDYRTTDYRASENQPQINTNKQIDKKDKTKLKHEILLDELIKVGYIKENDEQLMLYDSLFDKLIDDGNTYVGIYSAIHYIAPRVISRCFSDEEGNDISNKFGYFKTSIESNIKKLASYAEELYPDDEIIDFKSKQSSKERDGDR